MHETFESVFLSFTISDSETALRLELVCSLDETGNGPSLLSSIDYCRTSAGTRMLRSNLLEPFSDPGVIESRLDAVEELVERPLDLYQPIKVRVTHCSLLMSRFAFGNALGIIVYHSTT